MLASSILFIEDMLQYDSTSYESQKGLCMKAYQVKISLKGMKPPIWRRMIIPAGLTCSAWTILINEVMGWDGDYDSVFSIAKERITIAERYDSTFAEGMLDAAATTLDAWLTAGKHVTYTYGAGDGWAHDILIEEIVDDYDSAYPVVLKGKSQCPPDTCANIAAFTVLKEEELEKWEPFWWNENLLEEVNTYVAKVVDLPIFQQDGTTVKDIYAVLHATEEEPQAQEEPSLEGVFLCLSDQEVASIKRAIHGKGMYRVTKKDAFDTLAAAGLVTYVNAHEVTIDPTVAPAWNQICTLAFQSQRRRYHWLMQCVFVCHGLYGITPLDVLVKVFNRHKRFTIDQSSLVAMLQQIPSALLHGEVRQDAVYYTPILQSGNALSILHDRQGIPFYIPTAAEIEAGFFAGSIWYATTSAVRQVRRVLGLVFPAGKLSERDVRQFLLGMMASYAVDSMIDLVERQGNISLSVMKRKAIEQLMDGCASLVRKMHYSGQMSSSLYHYV